MHVESDGGDMSQMMHVLKKDLAEEMREELGDTVNRVVAKAFGRLTEKRRSRPKRPRTLGAHVRMARSEARESGLGRRVSKKERAGASSAPAEDRGFRSAPSTFLWASCPA